MRTAPRPDPKTTLYIASIDASGSVGGHSDGVLAQLEMLMACEPSRVDTTSAMGWRSKASSVAGVDASALSGGSAGDVAEKRCSHA